MNSQYRSPTIVNLEITDVCNAKCRHCYNFWRESGSRTCSMSKERLDELIQIFADNGIFHVIITGGEPFARFDLLKHAAESLVRNNITISCNSNLMLADKAKLTQLRDVGLDHILTSLNSYDEQTNDYMVNKDGAFRKIVESIQLAVSVGIRVSANMIVSEKNRDHVYKTALFAHELGCQKIFGTRVVPSVNTKNVNESEFYLTRELALNTIDQLVKAKNETGIMIGTLVSYPLCLLGDLEKYKDFVGRGCPGQSGHLLCVNANGDTHACVHQMEGYGNIFSEGIDAVYRKMHDWHEGTYLYDGCSECKYRNVCKSGCRMSAHAYYGDFTARDPLMIGPENIENDYAFVHDGKLYDALNEGVELTVPKRLRFRKEDGFFLCNIRWANTIEIGDETARILMEHQQSGTPLHDEDIQSIGKENVAKLYYKDVIEAKSLAYDDDRDKLGLSIDPNDIVG